MMKAYKGLAPILLAVITLTAASCDNFKTKDAEIVEYDQYELHYQATDGALADFLNDFSHRNLRYDDYATGMFAVGDGTGFAKNWETMGLAWHNSAGTALGENKMAKIYTHLASIDQDGLGMIYNTHNSRESSFSEIAGGAAVPQGWPFPSWYESVDDPIMFGKLKAQGTTAFEFNKLRAWQSDKWVAEGGTFEIDGETGYAHFATDTLGPNETFRFYRTDITELERAGGVMSEYSPFIELALDFKGYNMDDYYVIWQTAEGGDQWYSIAHNYVATTINDSFSNYTDRCYLEMYLAENWDKQVITKIGLEFRPKEGEKLTVKSGQIDYIRCQYDTRQSNATYQWILSLYNYVRYTNDMSVLEKLMPKARRAMLFLTHVLEGEKGLLDISYMYGHNGIGMYKKGNGSYNFDTVNGVGNGYWDLTVSSKKSFEANMYFYQALLAMAALEQRIVDADITITEESVIRNRLMFQEPEVEYNYTAETLTALADTVKQNMEKAVQPQLQENGEYDNVGGFWNPTTGRFVSGINEATGAIADYGYVYWNLEAICAGLGTDEQQLSIMQWIDGQRMVEGDLSTGNDIYFYEFAPRFNTKDAKENCSAFGYTILNAAEKTYGTSWSRQLQNGGAAIAWSYYDIVARTKVLGADNAFKRLKEIQVWYEKVLKNTDGDGWDFYGGYYEQLAAEADEKALEGDTSEYGIWNIQDASRKGAGAIGLDAEFIESVIFIKALPDAFLGMETNGYDNISFQNNLPKDLDTFQIDNMKFNSCIYSVRETSDGIEILNVKGMVKDTQTVTIRFEEPSKDYSVYINGKKTEKYSVENGIIYVTVPFDLVKVTVK